MEFGQAIRSRRMVRSYRPDPVPDAAIDRIVAAGLSSPAAGNTRGQRLVLVTEPHARNEIAQAAGEPGFVDRGFEPWISSAPLLVVLGTDRSAYEERYSRDDKAASDAQTDGEWAVPWWWVDAGACLMSLLLAATAEDLAAGFLGAHACPDVHEIVGWHAGIELVGVVTIGVEKQADRIRRSAHQPPPRNEMVRRYPAS